MPRGEPLRTVCISTGSRPTTEPPLRATKAASSSSGSRCTSRTSSRRDARAPALLLALILAAAPAAAAKQPPPRPAPAPAPAAPAASAALPESISVELAAIARAEDAREWSDGTLRRALQHGDPAVRARAALAVGRLQDSTTVE